MGTSNISVRPYDGTLASLNLGGIANQNILNGVGAPTGGVIRDDDGVLDAGDSGIATFTPNATGATAPLTYVGAGTISLLGVFGIRLDSRDIMIFTAGDQVYFYLPQGLPILSFLTFRIDISAGKPTTLPGFVPCFGTGTMIATPFGEVPVEQIEPGDPVLDIDGVVHRALWTGHRHVDLTALCPAHRSRLVPVRIPKGALGNGLPRRDLILSQQHRVLMRDPLIALLCGFDCGFVPAKTLVGHLAHHANDLDSVGYHHILCARHVTLLANGAEAESLHLGDLVCSQIDTSARTEIAAIFPELTTPGWLAAIHLCHPALRRYEAETLVHHLTSQRARGPANTGV